MFNSKREYLELIKALYDKSRNKSLFIANPDCWPIIRIQLSYLCHLIYGGNKIRFPSPVKFSGFSFKQFLLLFKESFRIWSFSLNYQSILKNKILLVGFNNHQNEFHINPYINPIKNLLDKTEIKNEILFLKNAVNNKSDNRLSYIFYCIHNFYEKKLLFKKDKKIILSCEKIKKELKENFPFEKFDLDFSAGACNTIISAYIQKQIYYKTFSYFLKVTKPKIIWTYCYYDNRILSLNLAANQLKIPIIEYQHSAQGDEHFAYSKWENIDMIREYFPSVFWVWGNNDAEMIKKNFYGNIYKPEIIEGGNIFLALEKANLNQVWQNPGKVKGILVTLQGMWIPTFIEEAVKKYPELTWYFRLHPRYPNDKLKLEQLKLKFPDRVEVEKANELSLHQLFQKVRFNLTSFSGTAIEAQAFGVQNIIFSEEGKRVYKNMIENKAFLFASNLSQLENILNHNFLQVNFEYNKMKTDIELIKKNFEKIFFEKIEN